MKSFFGFAVVTVQSQFLMLHVGCVLAVFVI